MQKQLIPSISRGGSSVSRPILLSMLLSYLSAFLLPLFVAFYSSSLLSEQYRDLELQSQVAALQQTANVADANFSNIQSIGQLFLNDESVQKMMTASAPLSKNNLVDCWKLKKSLVSQQVVNPLIDEIFVYFPYSDTVLCTQGLYRDQSFSDACSAFRMLNYDAFLSLTNFSGNYSYAFYPRGDGSNGMAIVCKYYADTSRPANAVVVLTIEESALLSLANAVSSVRPLFFLCNVKTGLPAFLAPNTRSVEALASYTQQGVGVFEHSNEVVIQAASQNVPVLRYLSVLPIDFADLPLTGRLQLFYILLAVCLPLGIAIILHGIKRQYSPLRALYQNLLARISPDEGAFRDEYSAIENGVKRMLNDLENSREQLTERSLSLRNYIVERMIRGKYAGNESFERICGQYGLHLSGTCFAVAIVSLDDFAPLVEAAEDQEDFSSRQLIVEVIQSALNDALSPAYAFESAPVGDYLGCLISSKPEQLVKGALGSELSGMMDTLRRGLAISVSVAVGSIAEGPEMIADAYCTACQTMEYMQVTSSTQRLLFHCDLDAEKPQHVDWQKDIETQKMFFNNMALGNYTQAYQALRVLLPSALLQSREGLRIWQNRRLFLIYIVRDAFDRSPLQKICAYSLERLDAALTAPEFESALRELFDQAAQFADRQKTREPPLSDSILAYVDQHFASPDISISAVGETFRVSISCVSRCFKNATGVGLLDYIHMLRIRRAKELLEKSKCSVKDIAEQVGYISSLTMSRAFRRYEGITPTEYREMCRGK